MELLKIFDPTIPAKREKVQYAPRPKNLKGLRLGLVDNTKHNADVLLVKIAQRLRERFGMEMVYMNRKKSASDHVTDEAIREFKGKADFVIAGIGD